MLLNAQETEIADGAKLVDILYQVCLNGEFQCADTGNDTWLYTLTLDEDAMKEVAYAAAPQMEDLPVTLTSGKIQLVIKGDSITALSCECTGGLAALAETAPVTVSVKMRFTHNSGSEVPSAVQNRLIQERTGKMANKIIYIAREFGSGGHEIAVRTANRLGALFVRGTPYRLLQWAVLRLNDLGRGCFQIP